MDDPQEDDVNRMDTIDLTGRTALVTGAASGIGQACARRLATAGAKVLVCDVDEEGAARVADEIGGEPWVADLSDLGTLDERLADGLPVDILVNNAGIQHVSPLEEFPPDRFDLIVRLMLLAPFRFVRAALPHMYDRGWGRIVNVSSAHGLTASPYKSAYVSAKHGLEGLSKVTALEAGGKGVTSNCVNPGYVRTPLVEKQIADQARTHGIAESEVVAKIMLELPSVKRLVEPGEVAEMAAFLCGPASTCINGASLSIDGGWTAR
ncbi:MAG TPA: 3-hydroxybutyrate dehydrogenase [Marmoricola sp.]